MSFLINVHFWTEEVDFILENLLIKNALLELHQTFWIQIQNYAKLLQSVCWYFKHDWKLYVYWIIKSETFPQSCEKNNIVHRQKGLQD